MLINAPISVGELVDKITILEIKLSIFDEVSEKYKHVLHELTHLQELAEDLLEDNEENHLMLDLKSQLEEVNRSLWEIEDDIRECEHQKDFTETFIQLARSVYITNDRRAELKKQINLLFNSTIIEEKSYKEYL